MPQNRMESTLKGNSKERRQRNDIYATQQQRWDIWFIGEGERIYEYAVVIHSRDKTQKWWWAAALSQHEWCRKWTGFLLDKWIQRSSINQSGNNASLSINSKSRLTLRHCHFSNNNGRRSFASAFRAAETSLPFGISNSTFNNNTSANTGGAAILVEDESQTIHQHS